ncbi:hypothetical protein TVAG_202120 [Trichomonas vaginalis G3]|uniref:Uncharacterized protein n=1 Tax=Trichomonas vaginalis (strain ATCC PRA-98 / G3) TaxID=412133 RepID=A2DWN3_TRIV3|nr:regulation of microtubule-based process [Trichomonas vaginalis G3]EAY15218.1 hypothetical protein TVAG_202120 [Trichomonas vaginalis G3]KAI5550628.1 regulation of microtubule-based process [Trichomonas vaginalis G3]|eukprot:XP_001327441.1 hypothetical protein [Trichomonas vaginalis G3]
MLQPLAFADAWYPTGKSLENLFTTLFSNVKDKPIEGKVKAVISPHAGYRHCAETASHAFATIDPSLYSRVIIMGPSHRLPIDYCTISEAKSFETPTRSLEIDPIAEELTSKYGSIFKKLSIETSNREHSLELMLPWIDYIFKGKNVTVVPIMVGHLDQTKLEQAVSALKPYINDPSTLLVISSDFTHWGSRFSYTYLPEKDGEIWEKISAIDHGAMEAISTCKAKNFQDYIKSTRATICGRNPITIAMMAFDKPYRVDWPHYSQSSHAKNMADSSVSYAGGVIRFV